MTGAARWLSIAALVLAAASHGTFFAFSTFILPALGRLPAPEAARVMQAINAAVLGSLLIPALVGAPVAMGIAAGIVWHSRMTNAQPFACLVAAVAVYTLGVLAVTGLGNVPLNERLASSAANEQAWSSFATAWSRLNLLRTVASGTAVAAVAMALRG